MFSSVTRVGLAGLAAVALLGLSACSSGSGEASVTTVNLRSPSYSLKPPATSTTVPVVPAPDEEGRSQAEQVYTIHEDEYPFEIASLFDISLDELRNYNGWDESYSDYPGEGGTARIPPGAKFIDPAATTTAPPSTDGGEEEEGTDTATAEAGGDRCNPTYTIEAGDAPLVVTQKFDITLEQLNAANVNTPDWPNFYTGREIKLPPPADCAPGGATTTSAPG